MWSRERAGPPRPSRSRSPRAWARPQKARKAKRGVEADGGARGRRRAPRSPARGPRELADRSPDARDPALHRLGGDALRGVLRLVLLPARGRERRAVASGGVRAPE